MNNYETIIALVAPRGVNVDKIISDLSVALDNYGCDVKRISLLDITLNMGGTEGEYPNRNKIDIEGTRLADLREVIINETKGFGNAVTDPHEFLCYLIIEAIQKRRSHNSKNTVYILDNIKHPKELNTLKKVYKNSLYTVGITDSLVGRVNQKRKQFEIEECGLREDAAVHKSVTYIVEDYLKDPSKKIIEIDTKDGPKNIDVSNQVGEAYLLSDFFINLNSSEFEGNTNKKIKTSIERFVDLLFGAPNVTPTRQEHSMFLAYTSSIRSGDLSRQVGSAIVNELYDIVAVGANEVPKAGGGQYWANDIYIPNTTDNVANLKNSIDQRDYVLGEDTNAKVKDKLTSELVSLLAQKGLVENTQENRKLVAKTLQKSTLKDITEYGRVVHAEMSALMSAARNGTKVKDMTMFCTTYPCHNCAKHLVAAGIQKVHYIEPYPKSKAIDSHEDSIFDPDSMNISSGGENAADYEVLIDGIVKAYIDRTLKKSQLTSGDNLSKLTFEPFSGVGPSRYVDLFSMNLGNGRPIKRKDGAEAIKLKRGSAAIPRIPITAAHNSFYEKEFLELLSLNVELKEQVVAAFLEKYQLQDENRQVSEIKFWHSKHSYGYVCSESGDDFPFNKQNLSDPDYVPTAGDKISFMPFKGESVTFADKIIKISGNETFKYKEDDKKQVKIISSEIKHLDREKNYGFIKGEQSSDYFFSLDKIQRCSVGKLEVGVKVQFEPFVVADGKLQAKNIKVVA